MRFVASYHRGEGAVERREHHVGVAPVFAAPLVDALVYGARLEQVVALVRSAPGIEEGEHARYEKRRFVVRYGVGAGQYAACLAVVAVASGEEERIGRREGRGTGGIPEETALGDRPGWEATVPLLRNDAPSTTASGPMATFRSMPHEEIRAPGPTVQSDAAAGRVNSRSAMPSSRSTVAGRWRYMAMM